MSQGPWYKYSSFPKLVISPLLLLALSPSLVHPPLIYSHFMSVCLSEQWLHDCIREQEVTFWPALVLHYNVSSGDLQVYFWYADFLVCYKLHNNNAPRPVWDSLPIQRVAPIELPVYCAHIFWFSCCLCTHIDGVYREAAVNIAGYKKYKGEWLASCATGMCSYLCKSFLPLGT